MEKNVQNRLWMKTGEIILAVLFYYLINQFVVIFLISLAQGSFLGAGIREHILENWPLYSAVFKMAGMILGSLTVYQYYKKDIPTGSTAWNKRLGVCATGKILLTGAVTAIAVNLLFSWLHITQSSESYSDVAQTQFALPLWLAVIFYGVVSPVAEEVVFRGIVFHKIKVFYGQKAAVIGSALLFGVFHGNLVQCLYGSLMGILMALVYQRYGRLTAPILFHSAANIAVYCMVSIPYFS